MSQSRFAEAKAIIKAEYQARIDQLKMEMEETLTALSRAEQTLFSTNGNRKPVAAPQGMKLRRRIPLSSTDGANIDKPVTNRSRVLEALKRMTEDFTFKALHESANTDGMGPEIKQGSYAPLFAELVKTGQILTIKKPAGIKPGIFRRRADQNTESSPAML